MADVIPEYRKQLQAEFDRCGEFVTGAKPFPFLLGVSRVGHQAYYEYRMEAIGYALDLLNTLSPEQRRITRTGEPTPPPSYTGAPKPSND